MKNINLDIETCKAMLFGVAIGDALGVPAEFKSREVLRQKPVTGMTGHGSHNVPVGTFSDDSSLTFCLAEALVSGYDLNAIAQNFVKWRYNNFWTATGYVFDVGITTQRAIDRLVKGTRPDIAGDFDVYSNGNGSLMRIMPLLLYIRDKTLNERYEIVREVSSMTHGHVRSTIACFYYLEFARQILQGLDKLTIYHKLQQELPDYFKSRNINLDEIKIFDRLFIDEISLIHENQIKSKGYVLHTLEASVWCLLTADSFKEAVLKAVNLGDDTDTTGAVTGGLAGLYYGYDSIPADWLDVIARKNDIKDLSKRLFEAFKS